MAKKSKIARNEQRKVIVDAVRGEAPRAEEGARRPERHRREREAARLGPAEASAQRVAGARAQRATPSTAAPAATSRSSASRVSASATWRTVASCPASPSRAGRSRLQASPLHRKGRPARGAPFVVPWCARRPAERPIDDTPGVKVPESTGNPRKSGDLCYIRGGPTGHRGRLNDRSRELTNCCTEQRRSEEDIQWLTSRSTRPSSSRRSQRRPDRARPPSTPCSAASSRRSPRPSAPARRSPSRAGSPSSARHRAARTGRNPQTGAEIQIPAGHSVKVSAGSKLKAAAK